MKKTSTLLLFLAMSIVAIAQNAMTEKPEGEEKCLYRQSDGYMPIGEYVYTQHTEGGAAHIVKAADGSYYLQQPISTFPGQTWIKLTPDGTNGLKAAIGQVVDDDVSAYYEDPNYNGGVAKGLLAALRLNSEGNSYEVDPNAEYLHFSLNDGTITLREGEIMGIIDGNNNDWTGFCDYAARYEEVKDYHAEVPNDIEQKAEDYFITFNYGQKARDGRITKVAFYDDKLFILINESQPQLWMCGQIDNDKVVVPANEYFGFFQDRMNAHLFVSPVTYEQRYDDGVWYNHYTLSEEDIVFDFDKEQRTLTTEHSFLINAAKYDINYIAEYCEMEVNPLRYANERPQNPAISYFRRYIPADNWGMIEFQQPPLTTSGAFLPYDKIYFNIYFDDEKVTFAPPQYQYLTTEMTDIPLFFADAEETDEVYPDFIVSGRSQQVFFYRDNLARVGVQTFFDADGKRFASDIVYSDGSIVTGIKNLFTTDNIGSDSVTYYDLQGRKVNNPSKGIYISKEDSRVRTVVVR